MRPMEFMATTGIGNRAKCLAAPSTAAPRGMLIKEKDDIQPMISELERLRSSSPLG